MLAIVYFCFGGRKSVFDHQWLCDHHHSLPFIPLFLFFLLLFVLLFFLLFLLLFFLQILLRTNWPFFTSITGGDIDFSNIDFQVLNVFDCKLNSKRACPILVQHWHCMWISIETHQHRFCLFQTLYLNGLFSPLFWAPEMLAHTCACVLFCFVFTLACVCWHFWLLIFYSSFDAQL